jgi:hypothetical protein
MDETGKKLLSLMFRPGERVCVSHNKYGYHSMPLSEVLDKESVTMVPTQNSCIERKIEWVPENFEKIATDRLLLVSLNPNNKWRNDESVTAYRNILIEMDTGSIKQQLDHIKAIGVPYSAAVFSGNKSIHFLISLDKDLPDEKTYRLFSMWVIKAIPLADQQTFNPSRSIRIPGAYREPGKKQRLMEYKGPVAITDLMAWLRKHPDAMPVSKPLRERSEERDYNKIRPWAKKRIAKIKKYGLDKRKGRSDQWYALAFEFALSGYSEDDTLRILGGFFEPERDYKEKEWKATINSAFKRVESTDVKKNQQRRRR